MASDVMFVLALGCLCTFSVVNGFNSSAEDDKLVYWYTNYGSASDACSTEATSMIRNANEKKTFLSHMRAKNITVAWLGVRKVDGRWRWWNNQEVDSDTAKAIEKARSGESWDCAVYDLTLSGSRFRAVPCGEHHDIFCEYKTGKTQPAHRTLKVVGIAIGIGVVLSVILVLGFIFCRRYRRVVRSQRPSGVYGETTSPISGESKTYKMLKTDADEDMFINT